MPRTNRPQLIFELMKAKVPRPILKSVAKVVRSPVNERGKDLTILDSMSDKALSMLHEIFVKKDLDRAGRYLEYRLGGYLLKKFKPTRIEFRRKIHGESSATYEVDVVGENSNSVITVMAESKSKGGRVKKEDVTKFLHLIEDTLGARGVELQEAILISIGGLAEDAKKILVSKAGERGRFRKFGLNQPFLSQFRGIQITVLEERQGKIMKVYP